jgi:transposase
MVSLIVLEVVSRIDALFDIGREINGQSPENCRTLRQALSKPVVGAPRLYLDQKLGSLPRTHDLYKAMSYMMKR